MRKLITILLLSCISFISYAQESDFYRRLSTAAIELTRDKVTYDPAYYSIPYPNGDVPAGKGVCTDVVIRAYRKLGIDLQQKMHEDMKANFSKYPTRWGMKKTDRNIDHRRVLNQQMYFSRFGIVLPISDKGSDYKPGDIVAWDLGGGITHIGIVTDRQSKDGLRPLIVHNIGRGQVLEDMIFNFKITGHYQYK
ncbi:DUF1287 domain-containing protein [Dysgonomonas sp. ZJ279]|uniref:DUF1287 domain-containing protein n=1 Tax=Dysgonomonas sp. ZJ279 TaxID=2709796 RepID=UPI0013ED49E1|nr:DUF1287 domain-containing protein [Dysgonomonas sp. ZJ279]